jgi:hypothetical protein
MNRLVGALDLVFGVVFVVLGLAALSGTPATLARLGEEPEDFYGLLFLFVASAGVGVATAIVGSVLIRGRRFWKVSVARAALVSAGAMVLLILASVIGFWPNDPGSAEVRLLLIPAGLLAVSCLLLRHADDASGI